MNEYLLTVICRFLNNESNFKLQNIYGFPKEYCYTSICDEDNIDETKEYKNLVDITANYDDFVKKYIYNLRILYIGNMSIIPNNLCNLREFDCENNNIKEIPDTLTKLVYLNCSNNDIEKIPNSLINLKQLICTNNNIKKIPYIFKKLTKLECADNKLKSIPLKI
jgi:Leucine-rich repeat (LRR) protein